MAPYSEETPPQIPTIDISPYLSDPSSPAAKEVVNSLRIACIQTGFFHLAGHSIPSSLQQTIFHAAKEFFSLPLEEKLKLDMRKHVSKRGYEIIGGQKLGLKVDDRKVEDREVDDGEGDLKEGFYIGRHTPYKTSFMTGPNIFPPSSLLSLEIFQTPIEEYYSKMLQLMLKMHEILAETLPYGKDVFKGFLGPEPVATLRLLHYPPAEKGEIGAGAHTDLGALTLLLQDETSGLEVFDSVSNCWIEVPPKQGAYVVNIGDTLQLWTKNLYKSSLHRVRNRSGKERYSVPFFFNGNLNCVLDPLDGSKGEGITVEGLMRERISRTYGIGKDE